MFEKNEKFCILRKLNELVNQTFTSPRASSKLHPVDSDVFQDDTSSTNGWWTGRKRRCRVAPSIFPFSPSYFKLAAYAKLLQAFNIPLSFRAFLQLQSLTDRPPPSLPSRCRNVPTSGYLVLAVRSSGETLQKCPATGTPPSAFCRTRHWSMQWQVQW